jgi:hypothetical protein
VASGAHRPTTLGERLLQRLLGESLSEQFLNAVPLLTRILYQFNHLGIPTHPYNSTALITI